MKQEFHTEYPNPQEEKVREVIHLSKEMFYLNEAELPVSRLEFLYQQSKFIRKRWWALQGLLLVLMYGILLGADTQLYLRRSLGVSAPLFVILILPEIWKNRSCGAIEVEGTTWYTLRQIYAARMTLCACMDGLLLAVFFLTLSVSGQITLWDFLVQFQLPFNVTCCLCFGCLYSHHPITEALSLLLCCLWSGFWWIFVLNEQVYYAISLPIWALMLSISTAGLFWILLRGQMLLHNTMEVKPLWN